MKGLTRDQDGLIPMQTRLLTQLTACLKASDPVAVDRFAKWPPKSPWRFLQTDPTAQAATASPIPERLQRRKHPHTHDAAIQIVEQVHQPDLQADCVALRPQSRLLLALLSQVVPLLEQIAPDDKELRALFLTHDEHVIFESLPRAGQRLAPRRLAQIGEERQRSRAASRLQALAGTSPVLWPRGTSSHAHRRVGCIKALRTAWPQVAWPTTQREAWARDSSHRKRAEGKRHSVARRALGNVWLRTLFAICNKKECSQTTPFEQAQHQPTRTAA